MGVPGVMLKLTVALGVNAAPLLTVKFKMPLPTWEDFGEIVITQEFCEIFTKEFEGIPR